MPAEVNSDAAVVPLAENNEKKMAKITPTNPEPNLKAEAITSERAPALGAVPMSVVTKNVAADTKVKHWIPKHINMRVCKWFVPRPKQTDPSDPTCHCNYVRSRHSAAAIAKYNEDEDETKWKADLSHTEAVPTDAFGDIEFIGYGKRMSKFVRLEPNTRMDLVLELMLEHWQLDPPKLLISVTGGAKNFHMQPRLSEVFRRGLMTAASSTGAWIITGGMYAGVMKLVGQAVADWMVANGSKTQVTAIGLAPWGCVNNKESLTGTNGGLATYRLEKPRLLKHSPIDMNHSHFIFVDNGTQQMYATEIAFRAQLEKAVNTMGTDAGGEKIEVPVVCVVVEGGPGTLETVMRALQSGTPAVIIEGSRRAADILAYAYTNSHEIEVNATDNMGKKVKKMVPVFDDELWTKVRQMIHDEFGDRDIDSRLNWVKECFQYRHNMTIFRLDGGEGTKSIDVAILQALLKANKEQVNDQLKLALAWNRIDVAESDIFTEDKRWEKGELDDAMYMALVKNRTDFIKLLLGNGLSLKDFLTVRTMLRLYNDIPENSILYSMLRKGKRDKEFFSLEDVGEVIQDLTGDFYQPLYLRDSRYKGLNVDTIMRGQASRAISTININEREDVLSLYSKTFHEDENTVVKGVTKIFCYDAKTGEHYVVNDFNEPARELFIWAVLLNRFEMAKVFWKEGKGSIAASLTAEKMIMSMLDHTEDTELVKLLEDALLEFKELSLGVLSECHSADEKKAGMLLVRRVDSFGEATAMQLAVSADNKEFISHAACQSLLNSIWRGRMSQDPSLWRLGLCVIFPPLVYALITFESDDKQRIMKEQQKEKERRSKAQTLKRKELEMLEMNNGDLQKVINSRTSLIEDEGDGWRSGGGGFSCLPKLVSFLNAPLVTFIYNCMSYIAFLLLYSVMILTDLTPDLSVLEVIIIVWVFTLFTEEIRQVIMDESTNISLKFVNYFSDPWNIVDFVCLLSYIIGLVLRLIPSSTCPSCFFTARIILALNLMTFYFRILHMFSLHKELGPKLVMIGRMMIDLMYFFVILLVFIIAFGVASQAIMYPNTPISWQLIIDILRKPYWQMYGELFLEELEGDISCSDNATVIAAGTLPRCPVKSVVVPILLGVYILITNVLMLNLLIAMFSYTFDSVQTENDLVWNFERYSLIKEFSIRPPLAPPLIFFSHIYLFFKAMFRLCCGKCCGLHRKSHAFKVEFSDEIQNQLILWENLNQDDYVRNSQMLKKAQLDHQVSSTHEMALTILNKVDVMAESNFMLGGSGSSSSNSSSPPKLPPALDERMTYLEEQMKRTSCALDWIIKSLSDNKLGAKEGPPKLPDIDKMKKDAAEKRKALEEKEKEQVKAMVKRQLELHIKSRTKQYACPDQIVYRFPVPDDKVMWDVTWNEYDPVTYTDKIVLEGPTWADIDLLSFDTATRPMLPFNEMDEESRVDRRSFICTYNVKSGIPINPKGRTGLNGRGMLGRWGPNHAGDPIVTRWARNDKGEFIKQDGKKVLEFVSVQRQDTKQWAIPGGLLQLGQSVDKALKAEFTEEALGDLPDLEVREQMKNKLTKLFADGVEVYKGYSDDPRNTDNAWVETTAVNFHDNVGVLTNMVLRAGGTAEMVRWMKISTAESLYAAHIAILQKVALRHEAAF